MKQTTQHYFFSRHTGVLALLCLISGIAYFHSLPVGFLSDDFSVLGKIIFENKSGFAKNFFRPITDWSYQLNHLLHELNPSWYRANNILLHAANSFLVYFLSLKLLQTFRPEQPRTLIAAIAGLLFAILPSHSESVIWIASRGDLLATCFSLLTLIFYLDWLQTSSRKALFFLCASLLLGLLSKESAFALPIMVIFLHLLINHQKNGERPQELFSRKGFLIGLILFVTAAYFLCRKIFIGKFIGGVTQVSSLQNLFENLFIFFWKAFSLPLISSEHAQQIFLHPLFIGAFFLLLLGLITLIILKRNFLHLAIIGLFFIALLPVAHRPVGINFIVGERYIYLASVFSCILTAHFIMHFRSKRLSYALFGALCVFYTSNLQQQTQHWIASSNLATQVMQSVKENAPTDQPFALAGLPAFYMGVHTFNIGFHRAYQYFYNTEKQAAHIFTPLTLNILDKDIHSISMQSAYKQGKLDISLKADKTELWPGPANKKLFPSSISDSQATLESNHKLSIADLPVYLFCRGSMLPADHCLSSPSSLSNP